MKNEVLKEKLEEFINLFESETEEIKKQIHFNSTLNIINQLLKFHNNKESEKYKSLMADYIDELKVTDLPTGKKTSLDLYGKYVLKSGQFLTIERDFRNNNGNLIKYLGFGIVLDLLVYYFLNSRLPFYLPIFTLIFTILGVRKKKKMITDKKSFGIGF
ncbi:hypothetical protein GSB9_03218 [Flavobacteriaceae bacterium GSB9]|nr:hypothetical protein GSB9_03218 [Flavobacteriaceae bacterium GSB9]